MKELSGIGSFILFALSAIGAIIFFYYSTSSLDINRHENIMAQLYELNSLNSELDKEVLKARSGLLSNYDGITRISRRFQQVRKELETQLPNF